MTCRILNLDTIMNAARDNIASLIGRRIPITQKGTSWKGSCPFHQEKTPSFTVTPSKGMFKCFGCGAGGDAVKFIQTFENVDFLDAIQVIAAELGIVMEFDKNQNTKNETSKDGLKLADLYKAVNAAADFYYNCLLDNTEAMEYLYKRGFDDRKIKKYKLGYAKGNSVKKCAPEDALIAAGILGTPKQNSKNQESYDPLHGRIIVPLKDSIGRTVAFTGRLMSPSEDQPKYKNTPETRIFKKSEILFGLDVAREMLRITYKNSDKDIYILEGQLKTIAALEAGYPAVSAGGTGFTPRQAILIKNLNPDNVFLAMDPDTAGIEAALRMAPVLRELELNVKAATLIIPEQAELHAGKIDTDDLAAAKLPIQWQNEDLIKWIFSTYCEPKEGEFSISSEEALKVSKIIIPLIKSHPNQAVAETEIKRLSRLANISEVALNNIPIEENFSRAASGAKTAQSLPPPARGCEK